MSAAESLPENAIGYRIAPVVKCEPCEGTGRDARVDSGICGLCKGDGTYVVVSDVAVEPVVDVHSKRVWREVPS